MKDAQVPNIGTSCYAFTRAETARLLGVSVLTIDRLTKRGILRPSYATGMQLYWTEEIQRFLRENSGAIRDCDQLIY